MRFVITSSFAALVVSMSAATVSVALPIGPDLVTNGSFEEPFVSAPYQVFTSIPGWTSTIGAGIEIQTGPYGTPHDGRQHVELDSFSSSNMFQDLSTLDAQPYLLEFAYSPRPGRSATDNAIDVFWAGELVTSLSVSGVGLSNTSWSIFSFNLVGASGTSRLEFVDVGTSNSYGGYIDGVSVRAVPEPSVAMLISLGLLGFGFLRGPCSDRGRRRRLGQLPGGTRKAVLLVSTVLAGFVVANASTARAVPMLFAGTGNYYDFVSAPNINWIVARDAAAGTTFLGVSGHLATITSEAENDFIDANFNTGLGDLGRNSRG